MDNEDLLSRAGQPHPAPGERNTPPLAAAPAASAGRDEDDPQPLPEAGADLLDSVRAALARYVVLPDPHTLDAVTLWIAATHLQPAFQHAPRLAITGPQKRCGKSRLLDVIEATSHRPIMTVNATVPAIFRSIGDNPPTLLVDEADTIFATKASEQTEQLRGLLNAGHQRGRPALRATGKDNEVQAFRTFAMAALAGIGDLPDTIMDRAIVVRMRRRTASEFAAPFRTRDADALQPLRTRLASWAGSVAEQAREKVPAMPVDDRAADTWEPLVTVAELAGGHWPNTAREACRVLTRREADRPQEDDYPSRLLVDVHAAFLAAGNPDVLSTQELIGHLCADEESPWPTYQNKGLSPRYLQMLLRDFDISSKNYRFAHRGQAKGFARAQFLDAWTRYCPHVLRQPASVPEPAPVPGPKAVHGEDRPRTVRPDSLAETVPEPLDPLMSGTVGDTGPGPLPDASRRHAAVQRSRVAGTIGTVPSVPAAVPQGPAALHPGGPRPGR